MIDQEDPVLRRVHDANPVRGDVSAPPIATVWQRVEAGAAPRRARPASRLPGIGGLVVAATTVVAVAVVVLAVVLLGRTGSSADHTPSGVPTPSAQMTFSVSPVGSDSVSSSQVARTATLLRARLHAALPHLRVEVGAHGSSVTVHVRGERLTGALREQVGALTQRGAVGVYDWEGSVLTPDGRTALDAFARPADRAAARLLSQGSSMGPGVAAAGSMTATRALRLAARIPAAPSRARYDAVSARCLKGEACLLIGPAPTRAALNRLAPPALRPLAPAVRVPGSLTIVAAMTPALNSLSSSERYFVLRGAPALTAAQLTGATSGMITGSPEVTFRLTPAGSARFQTLTRRIAQRDRRYGTTRDFFHLAIVVDDRLVSVPYIDSQTDPNGITTRSAEIAGGLTTTTARDLAAVLRFGPLPLALTPG